MSRYRACFQALRARREKAFIPFFVIGDPDYKTSLRAVKTSIEAGADMLELGIGFSDPSADGPSIQAADLRALNAGMTVSRCFEFIEEIRGFSDVPIGLLVYYNLILRRGVSRFYRQAGKAGVDGILAADVPIEEAGPVIEGSKSSGVDPIFMVTPTTTDERFRKILVHADGFLDLVALLWVTGARGNRNAGISRPEHVRALSRAGADGAIVGSAIVDLIARNLRSRGKLPEALRRYVRTMKKQTFPTGRH